MPTIPSSLADRYSLHAVLAARGDAVAVAATDEILERDVWITLLLEPTDERRTAFRQQAEALARRSVPGAPRVYDGSMRAPQPYVVTQPTADGEPRPLLDVLTDDDDPTAEIPAIVPPRATAARRPVLASATATHPLIRDSAAGPAPADAQPAARALPNRQALVGVAASVLLIFAVTAAVLAGTNADNPALADLMPVVQGIDATEEPGEEPTEPSELPTEQAAEEPTPAPEPLAEALEPPPPPAEQAPAEDPAEQTAATEAAAPAQQPGARRGQEAGPPGQRGGGPPAHAGGNGGKDR